MHFNLDNDYRLSPSLDHGGEFMYSDASDCSTYKHPEIHYRMLENPKSVRVLHPRCIPAGNITLNHYTDIETMMREAEGYTEIEVTDPETGEKLIEYIGSGSESLFPRWMQQSSITFVNLDVYHSVKKINPDTGEVIYVKEHTTIPSMEFDQKYMSIYQHESSYHSLGSTEEFDSYEKEMKQVMKAIDKKNWDEVEAFQHLDSHRYEMVAQIDSPIMDLERPMQGEY